MSSAPADDDATTLVYARPPTPSVRATADDLEHLPAVLTTREAATALRIGVRELRKLVDTGDIPAARFGPRRVIRIAKGAVLDALRGHGRRRP